VSEALPKAIRGVVQGLQPQKIVLFGSYATGKATPNSDVDLLVVMDSFASYLERYLAVSRLLRPRPFLVDIIVRTPGEMAQSVAAGDPFIVEILTQGIVLYERR